MGEAYFYHMTRTPLEGTLPVLLAKSLEAGWRVAVRGQDPARLDWLDQRLWLGHEESFLPHGVAGGPHDADQPVLLTSAPEAANGANCLVSIDGAEVAPGEVAAMERVMILFDGNDPEALQRARDQWRALTGAGAKAKYWSQESGRWEMKAEN
ncbi:DNA polymerase III subunit chi [Sinisalibacter aestuarii]|uniref:DNA polymerase III subunit chi n=1 Tax=Sinisalibacter aestuarii TaxID=2949426 RepID=A0ABQ5LS84_9RHOB|nr:DNA polymerase III subunit chi [Sinisalibacter aestuarii]GKY87852.1 DNA polymerase III subunit chi [Sinisalibacter aestuarii]